MLFYFLKSAMCLLLFWGFYKLLLEREKIFFFNRFFLLGSLVLSFVIPLITIEIEGKKTVGLPMEAIEIISNETAVNIANTYDWQLIGFVIYFIIVAVLLFRLFYNIQKIMLRTRTLTKQIWKKACLIFISERQLPHAFLNYIFINKNDFENGKIELELLQHELEHVKQRHSYDIIFIQILKAIFWFNPLLILFEKAIKLNHEFLADQSVIKQNNNIIGYQYLLLEKAKGSINNHYLASSINYLITKKRLEMMTKKTNKLTALAKTALAVVMCIMLCFVFSNKVIAQGKGVSDELMKEYKMYLKKYDVKDGETISVHRKDVERMNKIYAEMSETQQKSVKKLNLPPPPPPPPAPPVPPVPSKNGKNPPPPPPAPLTPTKAPKADGNQTSLEEMLPEEMNYFVNGKSVTKVEAIKVLKAGNFSVTTKGEGNAENVELYLITKD